MQWLRDGLKLIKHSAESEAIAASLADNGGVYLVPAFAGLGAPQWNAEARGLISELTRDSGRASVRAGLEAVGINRGSARCVVGGRRPEDRTPLVDGGMTANAWVMQFLAMSATLVARRPRNDRARRGEARRAGAAHRPWRRAMGRNIWPNVNPAAREIARRLGQCGGGEFGRDRLGLHVSTQARNSRLQ